MEDTVDEYLDNNLPSLFDFLNRNPHVLDEYIHRFIDPAKITEWLNSRIENVMREENLRFSRVDFMKESNTKKHHTDEYEHRCLVVRRSNIFEMEIYFSNRGYSPDKGENVVLDFSIGNNPSLKNDTRYRLSFDEGLEEDKWSCRLIKVEENRKCVRVQVNIPSNAIIGRYHVTVEVSTQLSEGKKIESNVTQDVIVIFNPFSSEDEVYMADEDRRKEYVLSDTGIIYYGQYNRIGGMEWLFGQYEPEILNIALKLLRESPNAKKNPNKTIKKRSSPVYCSRTLSAMVNNNDDDSGVLWGRWDGNYSDGVSPTHWSGSVKILKQWFNGKMAPVKYGQCWVFSGVLTTVLRAIGIPARSVTNFQSAHDTEFNMTIDRFVNDEGEETYSKYAGDSVWNFHVWNEGWFKRSDFPQGYNGWQAIDATPQEESDGIMRCGPAPVQAVKNGEIFIGFDTNFIFAEVNADRLTWRVNSLGQVTQLLRRETRAIGHKISTKAVGSNRREDITHEYKFPEGSEKERAAFKRAYAYGKKAPYHDKLHVIENEGAIRIRISEIEETTIGTTVSISVKVQNSTHSDKTVVIRTIVNSLMNNEDKKSLLKLEKSEHRLRGGKEAEQLIEIPYKDYDRHLTDINAMRVFTTVRVKETENLYVDSLDLQVKIPECLSIECEDVLQANQYGFVRFVLVNPLPIVLTGCKFSLEGNGNIGSQEFYIQEVINAHATFRSAPIRILPIRRKPNTLIADFCCNEISNAQAVKRVVVV